MDLLTREARTLIALATIGPVLAYMLVFGAIDLARKVADHGRHRRGHG